MLIVCFLFFSVGRIQAQILSGSLYTIAPQGGSLSPMVITTASWTVQTVTSAWVSVSPLSGTGNASITFSAPPNTSGFSRSALITLSSDGKTQNVTITQAAQTPMLELSSSSITAQSTGGSFFVNVFSTVIWSASTNQPWITVSPNSGMGNGGVVLVVAPNSTTGTRTGIATLIGFGMTRTITVSQAGALPKTDTLNIPIPEVNVAANAGTIGFLVTANNPWTATSNQAWLTLNPSSANGTANFQAIRTVNTTLAPRVAVVTFVSGSLTRTLTVTQSATTATQVVLSSTSSNVSADSVVIGFGVTANVSWSVQENVSWLKALNTSGMNNGSVQITVSPNTASTPRTGTVSVSGGGITRVYTVIQAASSSVPITPTLILSNTISTIQADSVFVGFGVFSNSAWTVQANAPWLNLITTSGMGNGSIMFGVSPNPTAVQRTGIITVSGGGLVRILTVVQNAAMANLAAPQNVVATATMQQNFTVQWQPVQGASNYEIQYSTDMNFADNLLTILTSNPSVLASATPQWSISAKPGITYFVRMRSVGVNNLRSAFSNVDTASTPPNVPLLQPANPITQVSFRVNWVLAEGAASYNIQVSTNATFTANGIIRTFTNIAQNNYMVTNQLLGIDLKPGAVYYFRVQSVSSAGVQSAFVSGTVQIPSSQLASPLDLVVSNPTKTGFMVNWKAVTGASAYEVQVSSNMNFAVGNQSFIVQGGSTTSLQVNNLVAGSTRFVRVRTLDAANGGSAYSNGTAGTTLPPAPAVPLAATNIGTNSFTANWQNSPDGGTTTLEIIFDSGVRNQYQPSGTSFTVTNLQAGSVVFYRVRANGGGAMTNQFSTQQIRVELQSNQAGLATPTLYIPTNVGMDNAIVRWQLISSATSYELQVASDVQFATILKNQSLGQGTSAPQLFLTGLPVGKANYCRVRALGANNVSTPYSNIICIATLPATPVIAAPTALQAISFTANWQAATGAKQYQITAATDIQFTKDLVTGYVPASQTSYTFTVPAGKTYYYRVRAFGEGATSLWSNFQTATLPQGTVNSLVAFDAVNPTTTSFAAIWQPVSGAVNYTVQVATNLNFSTIVRLYPQVSGTTIQVHGLQAGFTYYYRVIANSALAGSKNSAESHNDAASNVVAVSLPADVPTALAATNIGTAGFVANWESVGDDASYRVQVASDIAFENVLSETPAEKLLTSSAIAVPNAPVYFYRVFAVSENGSLSSASNPVEVRLTATSVRSTLTHNQSINIAPNPASIGQMRTIRTSLPESGELTVRVIDMLGREIATMPHGYKASGEQTLHLAPNLVQSVGVYMIRLEVNGRAFGATQVMVRN
jgi:hypothetical protein